MSFWETGHTLRIYVLRVSAAQRRRWVRRIEVALQRGEPTPADFIETAWEFERQDYAYARRAYYRRQRRPRG